MRLLYNETKLHNFTSSKRPFMLLCRLRRCPEVVLTDAYMSTHTVWYRKIVNTNLVLNKVGEDLPSLLSGQRGMNNDIIAWLPVSRSCHLMPVSELKS